MNLAPTKTYHSSGKSLVNEGATNNLPATDTLVVLGATTASLGDYVWNDPNADGIQDGAEGGIDGVTVMCIQEMAHSLHRLQPQAVESICYSD